MASGISKFTETQVRILSEVKSPVNNLIIGRPNDGQTLGLIIAMFELIDIKKSCTQGVFVCASKETANYTFASALKLSTELGIRCGLVKFDEPIEAAAFHCLFGTSGALSKVIGDGFGIRVITFDDANKSMSFVTNNLLRFGAKYICVSSHINRQFLAHCNEKLNVMTTSRHKQTILSPNLRHAEVFCESQFQKLSTCVALCNWEKAKQIIIFVLVNGNCCYLALFHVISKSWKIQSLYEKYLNAISCFQFFL